MTLKQRKQKVNQLSVKEYDRIQNSTTEFIIQSIKKKHTHTITQQMKDQGKATHS